MADDLKARVLAALPKGKQNAITGKNLNVLVKERSIYDYRIKDNRDIRLAIQELIDDGETICSSPGRKADKKTNTPKQNAGYFLAETPSEIKDALIVLRSYGKQIFHHYYALKKAGQKKFSGQLSLKI